MQHLDLSFLDTEEDLWQLRNLLHQGGGNARYLSNADVLKALNFLNQRTETHVVDKGETSTTWYRKYSDGWVEQGGIVNDADFYSNSSVTFPIPFRDTNYSLCVGSKNNPYNDSSLVSAIFCTKTSNKSSFEIFNYSKVTSNATWFACGYS